MPVVPTQQFNFIKGQVDDHLQARVDLELYAQGASELTNVFVRPQGGVARRPGTRVCTGNVSMPSMLKVPQKLELFKIDDETVYLVSFRELSATTGLNVTIFGVNGAVVNSIQPENESGKHANDTVAGFDVRDIRVAQAENAMIIVHPQLRPRRLLRTVSSNTVSWSIEVLSLTKFNAANNNTDYYGNPRSVTLHAGRLWFGGLEGRPNTVLASKAWEFFNFDTSETLDNYAIELTLETRSRQSIRHIVSGRNLAVFAEGSEWWCPEDIPTPKNTMFLRVSSVGVYERCAPMAYSNSFVYVNSAGNTLYELMWDARSQNYVQKTLNPHYTGIRNPQGISRLITEAYDNTSLLMVVNGDGTVACLSHDEQNDVAAWSTWTYGTGPRDYGVEEIVVNDSEAYVWMFTGADFRADWGKSQRVNYPGIVYFDPPGYNPLRDRPSNLQIFDYEHSVDFGCNHYGWLPVHLNSRGYIELDDDRLVMFGREDATSSFYWQNWRAGAHSTDFHYGLDNKPRIKTLPLAPAREGVTAYQRRKRPVRAYVHFIGTQDLRMRYAGREYVVTGFRLGKDKVGEMPARHEAIVEVRLLGWTRETQIEVYPAKIASEFEVLSILVDVEANL